jgi:hypothetical protein
MDQLSIHGKHSPGLKQTLQHHIRPTNVVADPSEICRPAPVSTLIPILGALLPRGGPFQDPVLTAPPRQNQSPEALLSTVDGAAQSLVAPLSVSDPSESDPLD